VGVWFECSCGRRFLTRKALRDHEDLKKEGLTKH